MTSDATPARTPQSDYLLRLGARLLEPYVQLPSARAAMITGSAAEGVSDFHSDLDMAVYYEEALPDEDALLRIREGHGAPERAWIIGDRAGGGIAEAYELHGIQVQIGHTTLAAWERDMSDVLETFNVDTPLQKALSGTLDCVPVAGHDYLDRWKARIAAYPDGLQRAMLEKHLQFFPIWSLPHVSEARDATLWRQQVMVESAFNLIAVLAAVNRRYFSAFQFKKMRRFLAAMPAVPDAFGERIESMFSLPPLASADVLESLVTDVVTLVESALPAVDTTAARRRLGHRRPAWNYVDP